jgi:hypothetical protein
MAIEARAYRGRIAPLTFRNRWRALGRPHSAGWRATQAQWPGRLAIERCTMSVAPMVRPTLLKRIASLVAMALLFAQLAVAAHACPVDAEGLVKHAPSAATVGAASPDCHESSDATDATLANLCAEHCKQGDQSERAHFTLAVPPALLNPLYATPSVAPTVVPARQARAWLSVLVAASPPHSIAHCVLRI